VCYFFAKNSVCDLSKGRGGSFFWGGGGVEAWNWGRVRGNGKLITKETWTSGGSLVGSRR